MTLATYTFLPWLRRGLSGRIETPAGAGASRAKLSASFSVASDAGRRDLTPVTVSLIGPGDVAGMQSQQIAAGGCHRFRGELPCRHRLL
jgi:hypothetical protein